MSERQYAWTDEAQLIVFPVDHPSAPFSGSLAECVRRAIEIAEGDPPPGHVEIAHGSPGAIQMDEIRRMAADPSFQPDGEITIEDIELGPMG